MPQGPIANRMHIFNSFRLRPQGNGPWREWEAKGEQMILCLCGFSDGFRVYADGEIATTVEEHNKICELLEGRDRNKI
ncbi:hypothetical protein GCM10010423_64750 [Streptomyces levis]|uniref:Uncharacterized protein n=1 Tax=Streptomyces levis TaxID=285566 RepID=A0ABN3P165_9ACTN